MSWPPDPQESITPALLNPTVDSQIDDQSPVLPVKELKSHRPVNNPYVDPPVHQLVVVNKATNTIHSPENSPTKDCYGWDPMLNGEGDDTNSDQDLDMPDDPHAKISGDTQRMKDQQFAHPTHISVGKDFMGLEDTLNNVVQQLGETVVLDPAEEVQALQAHKDVAQHDPILRAQRMRHDARPMLQWSSSVSQRPTKPSWTVAWRVHRGGPNAYRLLRSMEPITVNQMLSSLIILQSQIFFGEKEGR